MTQPWGYGGPVTVRSIGSAVSLLKHAILLRDSMIPVANESFGSNVKAMIKGQGPSESKYGLKKLTTHMIPRILLAAGNQQEITLKIIIWRHL